MAPMPTPKRHHEGVDSAAERILCDHLPAGRDRASTLATLDRIAQLRARMKRLLRDVYTREGAEVWLHGCKRSLAGRRPVDLLAQGSHEEVIDAIERLQAGAM